MIDILLRKIYEENQEVLNEIAFALDEEEVVIGDDDDDDDDDDCGSTTVFQTIDVCTPVTVTASAEVGPVDVTCCGSATVSFVPCPTQCNTEITFYVRRRVCAEIPITINVDAVGGTACVNLVATSEEGCQDCPQSGGTIVKI